MKRWKEEDVVAVLKCQAIATMLYILDMTFIKLSIGIFLLRFAVWAVYKWIIHISLVVITAWSLGQFIWNLFQCIPVEKQWDFRIQHGHCASASSLIAAAYALSVLNILSDWLYALLPAAMVWNVKMTKQAKIIVIVLLGLDVFASVATLVRLRYLSGFQNAEDFLYTSTDATVWTIVEPGVAIFAASLMTIRPLLRFFNIRGFSSADRTQTTSDSNQPFANEGKTSTQQESPNGSCRVSDTSLDRNHFGERSRQQSQWSGHPGPSVDQPQCRKGPPRLPGDELLDDSDSNAMALGEVLNQPSHEAGLPPGASTEVIGRSPGGQDKDHPLLNKSRRRKGPPWLPDDEFLEEINRNLAEVNGEVPPSDNTQNEDEHDRRLPHSADEEAQQPRASEHEKEAQPPQAKHTIRSSKVTSDGLASLATEQDNQS